MIVPLKDQKPIKTYGINGGLADKAGLSQATQNNILENYGIMKRIFIAGSKLDPDKEEDRKLLRKSVGVIEGLEFRLQKLWGFSEDRDYHSWWYKHPLCTCPTLDNMDTTGAIMRYINMSCPLHGKEEVVNDGGT